MQISQMIIRVSNIRKYLKGIIHVFILLLSLFWMFAPTAFAQGTFASTCGADAAALEDDPHPLAFLCAMVRVMRIFIYAVGLVFVAVAGYGGWKIALSLGDPKALSGGKLTWTYGVYGFFVVLGFFALFSIVSSILGIDSIVSVDALMERIYSAMAEFLTATGVEF